MEDKQNSKLTRIQVQFNRQDQTVDIKSNNYYGYCKLDASEDDFQKTFIILQSMIY